jgi:hypothetical protein
MNVNSETIHIVIAKEELGDNPSETDALALMLLLHTHHIWLREPVLTDRPRVVDLTAITRSHAAEVVAAAWSNRRDTRRTDYKYWLDLSIAHTPYEVIEDIPQDWMVHLRLLRERLTRNPLITRVEPED